MSEKLTDDQVRERIRALLREAGNAFLDYFLIFHATRAGNPMVTHTTLQAQNPTAKAKAERYDKLQGSLSRYLPKRPRSQSLVNRP